MPADWKEYVVRDLVARGALAINDGYRVRNSELGTQGIPFVRGGDIQSGRINSDPVDRILPEFEGRVRKKLAKPNDVAFIIKGTVGRAGIIMPGQSQVVLAPQVAYWRVLDRNVMDPRFLFYLIQSHSFQSQLYGVMTRGSMVADYVSLELQSDFRLKMPSVTTQKSIAHVLGSLDDKVELNRRMNETLEAMARALFKSWFVDFDPVRAKAEGRDPGLPPHLADLFPSSFVESDLGEIPSGWSSDSILSVSTLLSGGTPKTDVPEFWNGDVFWASAKDVSQNTEMFLIATERRITDEGLARSATQLIPALATVVVARGATTGRMVILGREMAMNQTCYALVENSAPYWIHCWLRSFIGELVNRAHGSVFDTITTSTFQTSRAVIPPAELRSSFNRFVAPLFERILLAQESSQTLATLRDTLLPKLISGELRVKDAERTMEFAL